MSALKPFIYIRYVNSSKNKAYNLVIFNKLQLTLLAKFKSLEVLRVFTIPGIIFLQVSRLSTFSAT